MKALIIGMMIVLVAGMTGCTTTPPRVEYSDRPLTTTGTAVSGPHIYSRTKIWKLQEQRDREEMRLKAQQNLRKRMGTWNAIHERLAWQNAVAAQREREKQAKAKQRFAGFF